MYDSGFEPTPQSRELVDISKARPQINASPDQDPLILSRQERRRRVCLSPDEESLQRPEVEETRCITFLMRCRVSCQLGHA